MTVDVLTGLLLVVTAFYAWATFGILRANKRIVQEMRAQSEALRRPYVTINAFVPARSFVIYLRIKNTGGTAAEGLRLRIDRDFCQFGDKDMNLGDLAAFSETIGSLPPAAELVFLLAPAALVLGDAANRDVTPPQFIVNASYSIGSRRVRESTTIDLMPYRKSNPEPDPLMDCLDKISKSIQGLAAKVS